MLGEAGTGFIAPSVVDGVSPAPGDPEETGADPGPAGASSALSGAALNAVTSPESRTSPTSPTVQTDLAPSPNCPLKDADHARMNPPERGRG